MKTRREKIIIYAGMLAICLMLLLSFVILKEEKAGPTAVACKGSLQEQVRGRTS